MTKRLLINIRIGATCIQSRQGWPFIIIRQNPVHMQGSGIDPKTKLQVGEFRNKPEWEPFAVYSLLGYAK